MSNNALALPAEESESARTDRRVMAFIVILWSLLLVFIACLAYGQPTNCDGDDPLKAEPACLALGP